MYEVLLSFITAFVPSFFIIPSVINVAHAKHLCDEPGDRRSHAVSTPSLGGVAIFAGLMFSMIFWMPFNVFGQLQYTLCAFIVIFLIGVKDDIVPISPYKKLLGELMAAGINVCNTKKTVQTGDFNTRFQDNNARRHQFSKQFFVRRNWDNIVFYAN